MSMVLLTGAGFSRNWGGWLAKEVFEYLIGDTALTPALRTLLWENRKDGFEAALNKLQLSDDPRHEADLQLLVGSLTRMFDLMNDGFGDEPDGLQVAPWLATFDSIFTLNQDTLLERLFSAGVLGTPRGLLLPGARPKGGLRRDSDWWREQLVEDPDTIGAAISKHSLPYFKLHGSSRLDDPIGVHSQMLIVGGRKPEAIKQSRLLTWYFEEFAARLHQPGAKLVVVGYGFRDDHVNDVIVAAAHSGLKLFIIDPIGHEVLSENLMTALKGALTGASRREVRSIFGGDQVELRKYERFAELPYPHGIRLGHR